jgi:predicted RNA binding protein YcfA (HicA-like mRNA interferase family)
LLKFCQPELSLHSRINWLKNQSGMPFEKFTLSTVDAFHHRRLPLSYPAPSGEGGTDGSMKLPRNTDGDEPASLLSRYGYHITHQTGSHQRLSLENEGKTHDLTIPRHKPLRVGTLHGILKDAAHQQDITREQVITYLFGRDEPVVLFILRDFSSIIPRYAGFLIDDRADLQARFRTQARRLPYL